MDHLATEPEIGVGLVVTNNPQAGVLRHAADYEIPTIVISRADFYESERILDSLHTYAIDYVALAGFLWLIPPYLVAAFPDRMLNIHPSLLPDFGGKGMYGRHVHRAVKAAGATRSGMTIHLVSEEYDRGRILFQAETPLEETDSPADIARKVLALEHRHYPIVLTDLIKQTTAQTDLP